MPIWLQWALGVTLPVVIGLVHKVMKMHQTLYGEQGTNGLKGDVKELRQWQKDLLTGTETIPKLEERARHNGRNAAAEVMADTQTQVDDHETRLRTLELKRHR